MTVLDQLLNTTIEERVSLLEIQVAEIEEDVTVLGVGLEGLGENVDFLFDEQVIQDERLLRLKDDTGVIFEDLDGKYRTKVKLCFVIFSLPRIDKNHFLMIHYFIISYTALQDTTLALDFRVTALEENGGSDGNSSVAELEVRVETLEGTAADQETRISTVETDVTGRSILLFIVGNFYCSNINIRYQKDSFLSFRFGRNSHRPRN